MGTSVIAIEIGGTKLQVVRGTPNGVILDRRRFSVDPEAGAEGIRRHIATAVPELLGAGEVAAIGVGFGGPVDFQTGSIACSHQVKGWSGFAMADWLKGLSGLPVAVDNDANVATLGEAIMGAGRGANPVFYVTLGSGVGGGLVVNGAIYHGQKPGESEIGHLRLDRTGTIVEQRCSGWATDRKVRAAITQDPTGLLARLAAGHSRGEARFLGEALSQQDAAAVGILNETAGDLALALSHVTHLFHPEVIVLGGGLSLLGAPLRDAVAAALPGFVMEAFHPGPRVTLAGLAEDAVPVGGLLLAAGLVKPRASLSL
ncbi:MAG: ROK family protein [Verrucomicrobiales bacterium]|nr:ROK family protein [Verrucomicrobiales bacterium]